MIIQNEDEFTYRHRVNSVTIVKCALLCLAKIECHLIPTTQNYHLIMWKNI